MATTPGERSPNLSQWEIERLFMESRRHSLERRYRGAKWRRRRDIALGIFILVALPALIIGAVVWVLVR